MQIKRVLMLLIVLVIFPLISAEIIISQQPGEIYSLGDSINVPVTIKSTTDISGTFSMDLLCNGRLVNFYKNGVILKTGEEKRMEASLILTRDVIGESEGTCKIKAYLGEEFALTNEFEISDLITITAPLEILEFSPGEILVVKGEATKKNGNPVNGFIEFSIIESNSSLLSQLETITNGFFKINITHGDSFLTSIKIFLVLKGKILNILKLVFKL